MASARETGRRDSRGEGMARWARARAPYEPLPRIGWDGPGKRYDRQCCVPYYSARLCSSFCHGVNFFDVAFAFHANQTGRLVHASSLTREQTDTQRCTPALGLRGAQHLLWHSTLEVATRP